MGESSRSDISILRMSSAKGHRLGSLTSKLPAAFVAEVNQDTREEFLCPKENKVH